MTARVETPSPQPLKGIVLKVSSVVLFSVMSALIKAASARVPAGELTFFRSFFGMFPIILWLGWSRELGVGLKAQAPLKHVWRGVIGTTAMALGFSGLAYLPLPEATVLGYASPLLVVIFAALILHETVRLFRFSAVGLGLLGVLVVLWPKLGDGHGDAGQMIGALLTLGGATAGALAAIQIRRMVASGERTSAVVFWFAATATTLSLFTLPFGWVVPTAREAVFLVCAGLLGGTAQILMTSAYRFADTSVVAPFEYTSILFAVLIGYAAFDEVPTIYTLVGASIVIFAGVLIILREHQLGYRRERQRKAMTPQG